MQESIHSLDNVFLEEELKVIFDSIDNTKMPLEYDKRLGRLFIRELVLPKNIVNKLIEIVRTLSGKPLTFSHCAYAEYSNKYGEPNLPVHFDGDNNDMVIDFQLESNTSWDLGIHLKNYPLKDNSALAFNANAYVHWRPQKIFKDGEYIKMLFFRFCDINNRTDYSYLNYDRNHPIFEDARKFRDSLLN